MTVVVEVVVVAIDVVITGLMVLKIAHFYSMSSLINIFLCIISWMPIVSFFAAVPRAGCNDCQSRAM